MNELKKERNLIEESASILMEAALKNGAEVAEVCSSYRNHTKISLEKQDFQLASSDEGFSFGLRVLRDGRQGFSSCNSLDQKELKEIAAKAVQIAGFSPANPHQVILEAENIPAEAPVLNLDESLFTLSLQTQRDWTKLLRDEAMKDARFRVNEGHVEIAAGMSFLLNSKGVRKTEIDAYSSWGLMGMAVEGTEITSFDYFHWISRLQRATPELLVHSTRSFTQRVLAALKTGPAKSYKGAVILSPRAVIDILMDGLLYHLNGRNLAEGTTRWKLADLEKQVLHTDLSLEDNPWLTDRTGFTRFDREGTPTRNRKLVENGRLSGFLFDHYAAHATGARSTGNASGGPSATPGVSPHCLTLAKGSSDKTTLFSQAGAGRDGFLLVHRFSGQVDPVTGDFSGVAKGAQWCVNGIPAYTVKETLISGNVFDAMGPALIGIAKETEIIDAGDEAPFIAIDNVSVTTHGA